MAENGLDFDSPSDFSAEGFYLPGNLKPPGNINLLDALGLRLLCSANSRERTDLYYGNYFLFNGIDSGDLRLKVNRLFGESIVVADFVEVPSILTEILNEGDYFDLFLETPEGDIEIGNSNDFCLYPEGGLEETDDLNIQLNVVLKKLGFYENPIFRPYLLDRFEIKRYRLGSVDTYIQHLELSIDITKKSEPGVATSAFIKDLEKSLTDFHIFREKIMDLQRSARLLASDNGFHVEFKGSWGPTKSRHPMQWNFTGMDLDSLKKFCLKLQVTIFSVGTNTKLFQSISNAFSPALNRPSSPVRSNSI